MTRGGIFRRHRSVATQIRRRRGGQWTAVGVPPRRGLSIELHSRNMGLEAVARRKLCAVKCGVGTGDQVDGISGDHEELVIGRSMRSQSVGLRQRHGHPERAMRRWPGPVVFSSSAWPRWGHLDGSSRGWVGSICRYVVARLRPCRKVDRRRCRRQLKRTRAVGARDRRKRIVVVARGSLTPRAGSPIWAGRRKAGHGHRRRRNGTGHRGVVVVATAWRKAVSKRVRREIHVARRAARWVRGAFPSLGDEAVKLGLGRRRTTGSWWCFATTTRRRWRSSGWLWSAWGPRRFKLRRVRRGWRWGYHGPGAKAYLFFLPVSIFVIVVIVVIVPNLVVFVFFVRERGPRGEIVPVKTRKFDGEAWPATSQLGRSALLRVDLLDGFENDGRSAWRHLCRSNEGPD